MYTCKREQRISLHRAIEYSWAKVFERLSALSVLDRGIRGACSADSEGCVDVDDDVASIGSKSAKDQILSGRAGCFIEGKSRVIMGMEVLRLILFK